MWKGQALEKIEKGNNVHKIERMELLEQGFICYADSPKEVVLTDLGKAWLARFQSADNASKRY